jgi:polar amino acid transport system ATP-binding protein
MSFISIRSLTKIIGGNVIFKDINAEIEKGERIALVGPSGAGKSTFLRSLNMLDPPSSGEVLLDGISLTKKGTDLNAVRRRMGMVFQDFGLFSHLSVLENVSLGPVKLLKMSRPDADRRALELLKSVGLAERTNFRPSQLSGGQKQRAAIARVLAMNPDVILFDEPTSALDPTMVGEVTSVIRRLAATEITMLIVTHEMKFAQDISTRVFYLDEGGIYEEGPPEEIFTAPKLEKTKNFINKTRSFSYELSSDAADAVELLNGAENFCRGSGLDAHAASKTRLVTEELVLGLVMPLAGACSYTLSYSEISGEQSLTVNFRGADCDLFADAADISAAIILKSSKSIEHKYENGENITRVIL